jgi:hypothetical protein
VVVGDPVGTSELVEMSAGRFYPVLIELKGLNPAAAQQRVRLEWTAPHGARYLIPRALLHQPTETSPASRS